jgi:hypothetical protein
MSRTLTFVSLMALGAALVGGAVAQTTMDTPAQKPHGRGFDAMDTNKDGALEKSEAKGRLAKAFDEIDANKDGKVTKDELKAGWRKALTVKPGCSPASIPTRTARCRGPKAKHWRKPASTRSTPIMTVSLIRRNCRKAIRAGVISVRIQRPSRDANRF